MAKDQKVIQRGVNVQDNDLALASGTAQHAYNIDFSRGGVAMRRRGFEAMYNGLPQSELDPSYNPSQDTTRADAVTGEQRNIFELFSRDRLMMVRSGMIFAYDEVLDYWFSTPTNLPHRFTFHGDLSLSPTRWGSGYGKSLQFSAFTSGVSAFNIQQTILSSSNYRFTGAITNDAANAQTSPTIRFRSPFDVVQILNPSSDAVVSDDTTIRFVTGSVLAGSITAAGSTNGTGTAARFSGASWMATNGTGTIWVADNVNQIRQVTSGGVVTTLAGSITAGDTDGTGTAARFRNISGLAYDGSQYLYVSEGASAHRVRRVDVGTGAVQIWAGPLTPASGYLDGTGNGARFNTPTGIEYATVNGVGMLYVGDSANNRVRSIVASTRVVGTVNNTPGTAAADGMVGGAAATALTPGVVVRGLYTSPNGGASPQGTYLSIECTPVVTTSSVDLGLVCISSPGNSAAPINTFYHFARCPAAYATQTTGPNKLDSVGPNAYSSADTRAVDVGGGVVFTSCAKPRAIDVWTKLATTDAMPRARDLGILQPEAPVATTTAGTTFANNTSWAYRTLCGLKLPDGRIATGPPSERVIVTNTSGGTVAGSITAFPSPSLPYDGMPFVQVYRTKTFSSALDPGDQMFLCYETPLAYGAGLVLTDVAPDGVLGQELYTNATADGLAYASLPPPSFATDICAFQQQVVLSNFIPQASVRVKLLGTSPITAGSSTVTLSQGPSGAFDGYGNATVVFTAIAGVSVPNSNQFQIASGGSPAQNAVQTARNIVSCINRSPDAYFFTAYYDEGDPGSFVVTSLYPGASMAQVTTRATGNSLAQSSITFSTNTTGAFFTVQNNTAQRTQNAAICSDISIYDSFPVIYGFNVGPSTEAIQRILPISDRLLAVKDDSVWSLDQSYSAQIYDAALTCNFPNSFAKVNNQWIGLFTRGFCALNSSQATAIGHSVDREVTGYIRNSIAFASAAAVDVYGNYVCRVASAGASTSAAYCYNVLSQSWSTWELYRCPRSAGAEIRQFFGAFRDAFVLASVVMSERNVFRQRDARRIGASYQSYSEMAYTFSGTLAADLKTIAVSAYDYTANPGKLVFCLPQVPENGVYAESPDATMPWALNLTVPLSGGGNATVYCEGFVVPVDWTNPTTAVTITTITPLTQADFVFSIVPGAVTVLAYPPTLCRVQYAPSVIPGSNTVFGDALVTIERSQAGPLAMRFFNRKDTGDGRINPIGDYDEYSGVVRRAAMSNLGDLSPSGSFRTASGLSERIRYSEVLRLPTPSDRCADQQLAVEIWEGTAWQPLAIKSVTVEERVLANGKVKQ